MERDKPLPPLLARVGGNIEVSINKCGFNFAIKLDNIYFFI